MDDSNIYKDQRFCFFYFIVLHFFSTNFNGANSFNRKCKKNFENKIT